MRNEMPEKASTTDIQFQYYCNQEVSTTAFRFQYYCLFEVYALNPNRH